MTGRKRERPGSGERGAFRIAFAKKLWRQEPVTWLPSTLCREALGRLSEGLDHVFLADATLLSHHDDGLGLGGFTGFDLDSLDACEFFERRTDALLTSGSSDTREGGLVFDVCTIGDAQQHNRQEGDKVMYFHCSRTDGVGHPRGIIRVGK